MGMLYEKYCISLHSVQDPLVLCNALCVKYCKRSGLASLTPLTISSIPACVAP